MRLDPNSETAHGSLALWYEKTNDLGAADREYRAAVSLDRSDSWAEIGSDAGARDGIRTPGFV